jgi:hypothetical protein
MNIKISTMVEKKSWEQFKSLSKTSRQSLTVMVTEAIQEYLRRKQVRPLFLKHMEDSIEKNKQLGKLLAK